MGLMENFAKLTPEQQKKFITIKDGAELEVLLTETGVELMPEKKAQILEYFQLGKLTLSDEELDNVVGGCDAANASRIYLSDKCPICGELGVRYLSENGYVACTGCGKIYITTRR